MDYFSFELIDSETSYFYASEVAVYYIKRLGLKR